MCRHTAALAGADTGTLSPKPTVNCVVSAKCPRRARRATGWQSARAPAGGRRRQRRATAPGCTPEWRLDGLPRQPARGAPSMGRRPRTHLLLAAPKKLVARRAPTMGKKGGVPFWYRTSPGARDARAPPGLCARPAHPPFGNLGLGGGFHAAVAPLATLLITQLAYDGRDPRGCARSRASPPRRWPTSAARPARAPPGAASAWTRARRWSPWRGCCAPAAAAAARRRRAPLRGGRRGAGARTPRTRRAPYVLSRTRCTRRGCARCSTPRASAGARPTCSTSAPPTRRRRPCSRASRTCTTISRTWTTTCTSPRACRAARCSAPRWCPGTSSLGAAGQGAAEEEEGATAILAPAAPS